MFSFSGCWEKSTVKFKKHQNSRLCYQPVEPACPLDICEQKVDLYINTGHLLVSGAQVSSATHCESNT